MSKLYWPKIKAMVAEMFGLGGTPLDLQQVTVLGFLIVG
jgi:hypothetical protein